MKIGSQCFFCKEEFYSDKTILQKKYSVGIIDKIKMRNIYNIQYIHTHIPIYIQLNTYAYICKLRNINNAKS